MKSSKDGIIGLAIGDALGVPVEFTNRSRLQRAPVTDMLGFCVHNVPVGTWSDDTSMALATMDAIIKKGFDTEAIGECFVKWLKNADYCAIDKVFDIGNTCLRAIHNYEAKKDIAEKCGCNDIQDNGNGSLMRILPIAYLCYAKTLANNDYNTVYDVVKRASSITHGHEISIMACFIYVLFAIFILQGDSLNDAYIKIQNFDYSKWFSDETISVFDRLLKTNIGEYDIDSIESSGYVLHTLEATFWSLLNTDNYADAVLKAVNLGRDTDTTGACVGGLAGAYYGLESIKEDWKQKLLKYDYILDLCEQFDVAIDLK